MNLIQFLNIFSKKNQEGPVFILKDLLDFSYTTRKKRITVNDCVSAVKKRGNVDLEKIEDYKAEFKEFLAIPNVFKELKKYDGEIRKMARKQMMFATNKKLKEIF